MAAVNCPKMLIMESIISLYLLLDYCYYYGCINKWSAFYWSRKSGLFTNLHVLVSLSNDTLTYLHTYIMLMHNSCQNLK